MFYGKNIASSPFRILLIQSQNDLEKIISTQDVLAENILKIKYTSIKAISGISPEFDYFAVVVDKFLQKVKSKYLM